MAGPAGAAEPGVPAGLVAPVRPAQAQRVLALTAGPPELVVPAGSAAPRRDGWVRAGFSVTVELAGLAATVGLAAQVRLVPPERSSTLMAGPAVAAVPVAVP